MHHVETIILGSANNEHQTCDYIDNTLEEHVKSAAVPIVEHLLKLAMHLLLADINLANQNIRIVCSTVHVVHSCVPPDSAAKLTHICRHL